MMQIYGCQKYSRLPSFILRKRLAKVSTLLHGSGKQRQLLFSPLAQRLCFFRTMPEQRLLTKASPHGQSLGLCILPCQKRQHRLQLCPTGIVTLMYKKHPRSRTPCLHQETQIPPKFLQAFLFLEPLHIIPASSPERSKILPLHLLQKRSIFRAFHIQILFCNLTIFL